ATSPTPFSALWSLSVGQVGLLAGDPAAAERWLRWGAGILERMGERGLRAEMPPNPARALAAQGRDDEALEQATLSGELAVRDDLYAQGERRGPLAAVLARRRRRTERARPARPPCPRRSPAAAASPRPSPWPPRPSSSAPAATCSACRPPPCSTWPGCCA